MIEKTPADSKALKRDVVEVGAEVEVDRVVSQTTVDRENHRRNQSHRASHPPSLKVKKKKEKTRNP